IASYFVALRMQPRRRIVVLCAAVAVCVAVFGLDSRGVSGAVNRIMLLDDQYRGLGTGDVGREERWDFALETFRQNPLFGVGFGGYFKSQDQLTPHNFWLYMLSQMGLLSIISIYALARAAYTLLKRNRMALIFCSSALLLTIFNDRFINMN